MSFSASTGHKMYWTVSKNTDFKRNYEKTGVYIFSQQQRRKEKKIEPFQKQLMQTNVITLSKHKSMINIPHMQDPGQNLCLILNYDLKCGIIKHKIKTYIVENQLFPV